jgi:hypothetical protein
MPNTLIFNSSKYRQDANTHATELRREYEMLVMFQLSRPLIKKIKSGCFSSPTKALLSNKKAEDGDSSVLSGASLSTKASSAISSGEEPLSEAEDLSEENNAYFNGILQERVAKKDKKVKKILECLAKFEEQAIIDGYVNKATHKELSSLVRKSLALCVLRYENLRFQQFESICLCILFNVVSKLNLSKKSFLKVATKSFGKKLIKISFIRKARCFANINAICSSF